MLVFHFRKILSRTGLRAVRDNNFHKNQCHLYGVVGVVVVVLGVIVVAVVTIVVVVVGIVLVVSDDVATAQFAAEASSSLMLNARFFV